MKEEQNNTANNIGSVSTHAEGNLTFKAAENINTKYIFGAFRGAQGQIASATVGDVSKGDRAICVITDCGNQGDLVNAQILGSNAGTMKIVAGSKIVAGDLLTSTQGGKAINYKLMPKGLYHIYGIAITGGFEGGMVEFTPTLGLEKENK
ncbi:MAG: hypothetical protein COZ46_07600 [Verrucomicrobia bacterium CG_4_10_14_3_um_filter_43_23]|nr:MAG: hypothetical protein AUJ82_03245 [Verrucomicrobia bacterium CG1_02_43_26]PIP59711.1 MAG: hypothetical protein COX01_02075 [Verrucomicrobia bacterium CG22_combo_CG10-13_8_21_14_all_43_17]PIX57723.1 MAG: hypothetical protein COZ46_07600 [Verrucomicrobia bacterium CG_4_10_14_3_um_filter_43_23]PIY62515.1 MAG: hypothetical protein COY94_01785 [Verrucomicrobia bacterium CG_4_10_14_0_8_um_filter_43_34]PJA44665.1 MAG: hypothetical protein CO175_01840 [Verrucomicrobia bacterium CG_4_9_14_3_um_fi